MKKSYERKRQRGTYEHVELFGKPALFTDSRIDRSTVPEGFNCYDLRGADYDPGKPTTLENQIAVNHAGTVLTAEPVTIPKEGFRRLRGKLNFLGECLTLPEFCEEHGIALPSDNWKFILRPASPNGAGIFMPCRRNRTQRRTPSVMSALILGAAAMNSGTPDYGYVIETEHYRYCLRCNPGPGDYHAYLAAFDLRAQRMNMKQEVPAQEHGLTEAGKELLRNAADNTRPHSYSLFVFQDYNTPGEKLTGGLTLPEAIRLYNEMGSGNKRLDVTKDEIATVDLAIILNGEQELPEDYTRLASFSDDPVIAEAAETLSDAITEQTPEQGHHRGSGY